MELVEILKLTMSEEDTFVLKNFKDLVLDTTNIKAFLASCDGIDFTSYEKILLNNGALARLTQLPPEIVDARLTRTVGRSIFI